MIGTDGFLKLINLWLGYSVGLPSNAPEVMMNWRMLGFHIGRFISPSAGTAVVVLGSTFTLILCLPFLLPQKSRSESIPLFQLFGIFAATLAMTWHSHQHMSLVLIPFFLLLLQRDMLSDKLFQAWVFLPFLTYVAVILIVILISLNLVTLVDAFGGLMSGTCMLLFNILILYKARDLNRNKSYLAETN